MVEQTHKTLRPSAIRWPGLAAFFIIIALLVAFSWLLLDTILKWTMEKTLGTLNGAEVNIASVEHQWVPLSLVIRGVELTDPVAPEFNRVAIGEISGEVSWEQLLLGRIHVNSANLVGIRVNTERDEPGEVYQAPTKEDMQRWAQSGLDQLQLKLPSLDDVMTRVDLKTPAAIEQAKQTFTTQETRVKEAYATLPTKEDLAEYEAQIKALGEGDVNTPEALKKRQEQFAALKEKFEQDRAAIKEFKKVASTASAELKQQVEAVKSAPDQDLERVQQLMQLNGEGLNEITAVIFGEQARRWSNYLLLAYEQVAPMMQRAANEKAVKPPRGEGIWFSFTQKDAPPDFLVKSARTEFAFGATTLDLNWQNITHQHEQLGQPTVFSGRADNTALWQLLQVNGELSMTDDGIDARQEWRLQGVQLANEVLSDRQEFSAELLSALLDSEGSIALRDNQFDGGGTVRLSSMQMQADADNKWTQVIANTLEQLNRLDMNVGVSGQLNAPKFDIDSDLDRQLGSALKASAMEAAQTELTALRQRLSTNASGFIGDNQAQLEQISDWVSNAEQRDQRLQELLQQKLGDALEDKLKGKLKGLLGGNR